MIHSCFDNLSLRIILLAIALTATILPLHAQDNAIEKGAPTQLINQDLQRITLATQKYDAENVAKLADSIRAHWQLKDENTYGALLLRLAEELNTSGAEPVERANRNRTARKLVTSLLYEEYGKLNLRLKVLSLRTLSYTSYDNGDASTAEENRFKDIEFFIRTEESLDKAKKTNAEALPPSTVDLRKYKWGNQILFTGMSPKMIKDPELRKAYEAELAERATIAAKSRERVEIQNLDNMFLESLDRFLANFRIATGADKNKTMQLLNTSAAKSTVVKASVQAKLGINAYGMPTKN
jgi:hypothetical protein